MNCPVCNSPGAIEVAEEVDIGVGVQKFVTGLECPVCGPLAVCAMCGAPNGQHYKWCIDFAFACLYRRLDTFMV